MIEAIPVNFESAVHEHAARESAASGGVTGLKESVKRRDQRLKEVP